AELFKALPLLRRRALGRGKKREEEGRRGKKREEEGRRGKKEEGRRGKKREEEGRRGKKREEEKKEKAKKEEYIRAMNCMWLICRISRILPSPTCSQPHMFTAPHGAVEHCVCGGGGGGGGGGEIKLPFLLKPSTAFSSHCFL
ncbi:unnamed protein product, partial [Closterium sp. NIES-54]